MALVIATCCDFGWLVTEKFIVITASLSQIGRSFICTRKRVAMRYFILLLPLLTLLSCASITEEQCRAGDWGAIGLRDGQAGRSVDYFNSHFKACAEVGVTPNKSQWLIGRAQGLPQYCTPENAYDLGRDGRSLNNVCPASQVRLLTRANSWGQEYYDIGQEIDALMDDIRQLEKLLAAMTGELTEEQLAQRRTYRQQLRSAELHLFRLDNDRRRFNRLPQSLLVGL